MCGSPTVPPTQANSWLPRVNRRSGAAPRERRGCSRSCVHTRVQFSVNRHTRTRFCVIYLVARTGWEMKSESTKEPGYKEVIEEFEGTTLRSLAGEGFCISGKVAVQQCSRWSARLIVALALIKLSNARLTAFERARYADNTLDIQLNINFRSWPEVVYY